MGDELRPTASTLISKVPEATALFWIIKVLTTGLGETTSDFLAHRLGPLPAVGLAGAALLGALVLQFMLRRDIAWAYWLVVAMVSVFGTMAADVMHVGLGVPYIESTALFVVALIVVFAAWYSCEKTLSIHSIHTPRREAFYWLVVLTTFALGTAAGDMTAVTMHLGYFASGLLFAVLIALPAVGYWKFGLNGVVAFWFAYVVTRPLGASFADWVAVSASRGGLALGTGPVSLVLTALILALVGYLALGRRMNTAEPAADLSRSRA